MTPVKTMPQKGGSCFSNKGTSPFGIDGHGQFYDNQTYGSQVKDAIEFMDIEKKTCNTSVRPVHQPSFLMHRFQFCGSVPTWWRPLQCDWIIRILSLQLSVSASPRREDIKKAWWVWELLDVTVLSLIPGILFHYQPLQLRLIQTWRSRETVDYHGAFAVLPSKARKCSSIPFYVQPSFGEI